MQFGLPSVLLSSDALNYDAHCAVLFPEHWVTLVIFHGFRESRRVHLLFHSLPDPVFKKKFTSQSPMDLKREEPKSRKAESRNDDRGVKDVRSGVEECAPGGGPLDGISPD